MNSSERRHLLFLKSSANSQRRNREILLASANLSITQMLESALCIYTPESNPIVSKQYSEVLRNILINILLSS